MNIVFNGLAYEIVPYSDAEVIDSGWEVLRAYEDGEILGLSAECVELAEDMSLAADQIVIAEELTTGWIFSSITERANVYRIPFGDDDAAIADWEADPQLSVALNNGAGGLLIPPGQTAEILRIARNMLALERGDCSPRTIERSNLALVGAVALGGATLALMTALFIGKK